jgi:hypothetical protein
VPSDAKTTFAKDIIKITPENKFAFSIVAGEPFRVESPDKHLIVFKISGALRDISGTTIVIQDRFTGPGGKRHIIKPAKLSTFTDPQIQSETILPQLNGDTNLINQFNAIINELEAIPDASTNEIYLMAITRGAFVPDDIVKNINAGWGMSLIDIGYMTPLRFSGSASFVKSSGIAQDQSAHVQGLAIDFSLIPYYLRTGLVLKPHSNDVVLSEIPGEREHQRRIGNIPTFYIISGRDYWSGRKASPHKNLPGKFGNITAGDLNETFTVKKINGNAAVTTAVNNALARFIAESQLPAGTFRIDDLAADDQELYHISVESVKVEKEDKEVDFMPVNTPDIDREEFFGATGPEAEP